MRSFEIGIVDANSEYLGIDRRILMENAGAEVARFVEDVTEGVAGKNVAVLAGPGNNGGDAMVAARHLAIRGAKVSLFLLSEEGTVKTAEAKANWEVLRKMPISLDTYVINKSSILSDISEILSSADVIIDGILGTGVKGELREPIKSVVEYVNQSGATIISIDVPSGIDPDTGSKPQTHIKADYTVTLHAPKPFMDVLDEEAIGEVVVKGIGAPLEAEIVAGPGDLRKALMQNIKRTEILVSSKDKEMASGAVEMAEALELPVVNSSGEERNYALMTTDSVVTDDEPLLSQRADGIYASIFHEGYGIPQPETARMVMERARRLGRTVYVIGGCDYISDGVKIKSNWIEPPIPDAYCAGVLTCLMLIFHCSGEHPFYAASAACYAARSALKRISEETSKSSYVPAVVEVLRENGLKV